MQIFDLAGKPFAERRLDATAGDPADLVRGGRRCDRQIGGAGPARIESSSLVHATKGDAAGPIKQDVVVDEADAPARRSEELEPLLEGERDGIRYRPRVGLDGAFSWQASLVVLIAALDVGLEADQPIAPALPIVAELYAADDAERAENAVPRRHSAERRNKWLEFGLPTARGADAEPEIAAHVEPGPLIRGSRIDIGSGTAAAYPGSGTNR